MYRKLEQLGERMQAGLERILRDLNLTGVVARQGSAFCLYFMDHCPRDWHDLAAHHRFRLDEEMRREVIARGSYFFPLATKQCSISFAHTSGDIDETLEAVREALAARLAPGRRAAQNAYAVKEST